MTNDFYEQILSKRSNELNQVIEELKKLEAYTACAKDIFTYTQRHTEAQNFELQNLASAGKITKETLGACQDVLRNMLGSLKSIEEESVKNFYMKLGISEFLKKEMSDLASERTLHLEARDERSMPNSLSQE